MTRLGWDVTVVTRVLVATNKVGVNINCVVTDSYYQHLPFVCGLGSEDRGTCELYRQFISDLIYLLKAEIL